MPKPGSINIIKRLEQMETRPLQIKYNNYQKKFLWFPTDIQWHNIPVISGQILNIVSKHVPKYKWLTTVYRREIILIYEDGNVAKFWEYTDNILDIIKRDSIN